MKRSGDASRYNLFRLSGIKLKTSSGMIAVRQAARAHPTNGAIPTTSELSNIFNNSITGGHMARAWKGLDDSVECSTLSISRNIVDLNLLLCITRERWIKVYGWSDKAKPWNIMCSFLMLCKELTSHPVINLRQRTLKNNFDCTANIRTENQFWCTHLWSERETSVTTTSVKIFRERKWFFEGEKQTSRGTNFKLQLSILSICVGLS